jgi:hypothetical protein
MILCAHSNGLVFEVLGASPEHADPQIDCGTSRPVVASAISWRIASRSTALVRPTPIRLTWAVQ